MRLVGIVLACVAAAACGSSKSDPEPEQAEPAPKVAEWPGCRALKDKLGADADVVFSPAPKVATTGKRWTVRFLDLEVAVPEAEYQVNRRTDGASASAILTSDDHVIALIKDPPLETQDDVFQVAGELATEDGKAATLAYFGKPPTLHDLALLGYQHTRADLTCAADKVDAERMVAAALVLKTVAGPGELVAVYRDRTGLGDITYVRQTPDGWSWDTHIPAPDAYYTLGYRSKARSFLVVGRWADDSVETGPDALRALAE